MASNLGNFLANKIIDHLMRNQAYSPPATLYVALHTAAVGDDGSGAEVSGGSYARQSIAFDAASSRATANTSLITFPTATDSWGTVGWAAIWDASSGGNLFWWGAVSAAQSVSSGQTATIAAGALDITITATP